MGPFTGTGAEAAKELSVEEREKAAYNPAVSTMDRGGSVEETAEVQLSSITVMREWKSAKAWLYRELTGGTVNGSRTPQSRR